MDSISLSESSRPSYGYLSVPSQFPSAEFVDFPRDSAMSEQVHIALIAQSTPGSPVPVHPRA